MNMNMVVMAHAEYDNDMKITLSGEGDGQHLAFGPMSNESYWTLSIGDVVVFLNRAQVERLDDLFGQVNAKISKAENERAKAIMDAEDEAEAALVGAAFVQAEVA